MAGNEDPRIKLLLDNIQPYPDFPKPGIVFQDIFGAMRKAPVLKCLMELTQEHAKKLEGKVDCVVGLDSRGFLFGPTMALELGVPFVPIRKKGKLPGDCSLASYDLEYGSASVELQKNAFEFCNTDKDKKSRILVVDDLLATGGTMKAAVDLCNGQENAKVTHAFVIMELKFIGGSAKIPANVQFDTLLSYN